MRYRILCLAVLVLLALPTTGWSMGGEIDPDGAATASPGASSELQQTAENATERSAAATSPFRWQILGFWLEVLTLVP